MKKIFQTLVLLLFAQVALAQQPCQAYFTTYFDPVTDSLYVYDHSYTLDSSQMNVSTYYYTINYFGGLVYTSSSSTVQVSIPNFTGNVYVCLSITTSQGCTSTYCDSVYLNGANNNCVANFTYAVDSMNPYVVHFTDLSIPEFPTGMFYYYWSFQNGTPDSSFAQNPVVTFPGNGIYNVCLTVLSDSGCTATMCSDVYISDSMQAGCYLQVTPYVTDVSTIGGSDGSIDLTVSGGTPPYMFQWNTGAVTEDLYGLPSGLYSVSIAQSNPACPVTAMTFQIAEPYDTIPLDTLYFPPIDTCLNFLPDSFYVVIVSVDSMNATVTWTLTGQGMVTVFTTTYPFNNYGPYVIALSINCDSAKGMSTYMTYVNFTEYLGIPENGNEDFVAYPNPFTDHLEFVIPAEMKQARILNALGQVVWSAGVNGQEKLSIDASSWKSGLYMIHLQGNSQDVTRILIKK